MGVLGLEGFGMNSSRVLQVVGWHNWTECLKPELHVNPPLPPLCGHYRTLRPKLSPQTRQSPEPCRGSPTLTPFRAEGRDKNYIALSE